MEHNIGQKAGDRRDQVSYVAVGGVSAAVGNFPQTKAIINLKTRVKGAEVINTGSKRSKKNDPMPAASPP